MPNESSALVPYPGLRPFRMDEDYLFFGREEQTAALVKLLREHRFLAVVGTSGSGKSSLVRAGLLPEIQGGMMQHAGSAWEIAILRPGGHPIRNLARALIDADLYDEEDEEALPRLLATLNHSALGLAEGLRQSEIEEDTNLLVVVDQFEELFRFDQHDAEAQDEAHAFVELLLEASADRGVPIYVVLTMRSDYLGDCAHVPGLAEAVNRGEYLIPRLERGQLRAVIEGPAKVGGGEVAYRLVQHLLNELGDEQDQLPVLQHALMRTWMFWRQDHEAGEPLDLRHYEACGGMAMAISNHADEIFQALPEETHRAIAERLFRSLTVKGSDNRGVRRPTRLCQLGEIAGEEVDLIKAVIDAYRAPGVTFLMPGEESELRKDTVIDLSHESLMRVWQRLKAWVETEAQSARIYERLVDTAALHGEGKAGLYHDPDLQIALTWREAEQPNAAWAEQYGGGYETAITFLDESAEARLETERAQEEARAKELEQAKALAEAESQRARQQQRAATQFRWFTAAGVGLAVVAMAMAVWAFQLKRKADDKSEDARLATLAAERSFEESQQEQGKVWLERARAVLGSKDHMAAKLMAGRALGFQGFGRDEEKHGAFPVLLREDSEEWQQARSLILDQPEFPAIWQSPSTTLPYPVHQVAVTPDGSRIFTLANVEGEAVMEVWEAASGDRLGVVSGHRQAVSLMAISPDGRWLAAGGANFTIWIWDAHSLDLVHALQGHRQRIKDLAFGPNGRFLFSAAEREEPVFMWDPTLGVRVAELSVESQVDHLAVNHRGDLVAGAGNRARRAGVLHSWRVSEMDAVATTNGSNVDVPGQARRIPVIDPRVILQPVASEYISMVEFGMAADGEERLLVCGTRMNCRQWTIADLVSDVDVPGELIYQLPQALEDRIDTFTGPVLMPDGKLVFADWWQGTVFLADPAKGETEQILEADAFVPMSFACSADGSSLLVGGSSWGAGRVRIWDAKERLEKTPRQTMAVTVAYSPDGTTIVEVGEGGQLLVRDATSLEVIKVLSAHEQRVGRLYFSRLGRWLISAGVDRRLVVWDAYRWEKQGEVRLEALWAPRAPLALSPKEDHLWVAVSGKRLTKLDLESVTFSQPDTLVESDTIEALAYLPDGRGLLVAIDGEVRVWNLETRHFVARFAEHPDAVTRMTLSPDGSWLVTVCEDKVIRLFELSMRAGQLETLAVQSSSSIPMEVAATPQFSPSGDLLAIGNAEGTIHLHRFAAATDGGQWVDVSATGGNSAGQWPVWALLRGHSAAVFALAFSPDGRQLVSTGADRTTRLWELREERLLGRRLSGGQQSLATLPGQARLVVASDTSGVMAVLDGLTLQTVAEIDSELTRVSEMRLDPSGRYVATAHRIADRQVHLWDVGTGAKVRSFDPQAPVDRLAFSSDGSLLVTDGRRGVLDIWQVETGGHRRSIELPSDHHPSAMEGVPGREEVAVSVRGRGNVAFYDLETGSLVRLLNSPSAVRLVFSPDGRYLLAAVDGEAAILMWDLQAEGTRPLRISGHSQTVTALAMNREGTLVASGSEGGLTKIWRFPEMEEQGSFQVESGSATRALAFGPGGQWLAVADQNGELNQFDVHHLSRSDGDYARDLEHVDLDFSNREVRAQRVTNLFQATEKPLTRHSRTGVPALREDSGQTEVEHLERLFWHYFHQENWISAAAALGRFRVLGEDEMKESEMAGVFNQEVSEVLRSRNLTESNAYEALLLVELMRQISGESLATWMHEGRARTAMGDLEGALGAYQAGFRLAEASSSERDAFRRLFEVVELMRRHPGLVDPDVARQALMRLFQYPPDVYESLPAYAVYAEKSGSRFQLAGHLLGGVARGAVQWGEEVWQEETRAVIVFHHLLRAFAEALAGEPVVSLDPKGDEFLRQGNLYEQVLAWEKGEAIPDTAQPVDAEGVELVGRHADWRYLEVDHESGEAFKHLDYDDSFWEVGPGPFFSNLGDVGEEEIFTKLTNGSMAYYFRHRFEIVSLEDIQQLQLLFQRDDGAVFYLNGEEVHRSNMPAGIILHRTQAASTVGGSQEGHEYPVTLDDPPLVEGSNVLVVEVHQSQRSSSDIRLAVTLRSVAATAALRTGLEDLVRSLDARQLQKLAQSLSVSGPAEFNKELLDRLAFAYSEVLTSEQQAFGRARPREWPVRARIQLALGRLETAREAMTEALEGLAAPGSPEDLALAYRLASQLWEDDLGGLKPQIREWLAEELRLRGIFRINAGAADSTILGDEVWSPNVFSIGLGDGFGAGATTGWGQRFAGIIPHAGELSPVYHSERWMTAGKDEAAGYRIPVPSGRYRVTLHFAEIYPDNARLPGRSMNVAIEGETVLENFELYREHGWANAVTHVFETEVADDWLDITFESVRLDMKVNGIEIERIDAP